MVVDSCKVTSIGDQHVFVLRSFSHLSHDIAFDRFQIELAPAELAPAPEGQLVPGGRLRQNWCLHVTILNLGVIQDQVAVMGFRESGCVGNVPRLQRFAGPGGYPETFVTALEDDGFAGPVPGDGAMNPQPGGEILDIVASDDAVERRQRKGPRAFAGAVENLDIGEAGDLDLGSDLLHFAVEDSSRGAQDLDLRVEQASERVRVAAFNLQIDIAALDKQLQAAFRRGRAGNQIGGADDTVNAYKPAIDLCADQILEGGRKWLGQRAVPEQGNFVAHHKGQKTWLRCSFHQDAIAGDQHGVLWRHHIDGHVPVLHIEAIEIARVVGNGGFKRHPEMLAGLSVGERGHCAQCRQWGRICGPGRQRADGKHGEEEYQSLHGHNSSGQTQGHPLLFAYRQARAE